MKTDYIVERRFVPLEDVEVRDDGATLNFRGHAAVFDEITDLGPWREQIAKGAFKKTIREADVRFLYNHEPDSVMARTKNGTLRLAEDAVGLQSDADLDPSDWDVQRLAPKLRARNVDQMSFAFRVVGAAGESWDDEPEDGGKPIRTLRELALFDVSAVTFPAYPQTDGGLRASINAVAERRGMVVSWDDELPASPAASGTEDPGFFARGHLAKGDRQVLRDLIVAADTEPELVAAEDRAGEAQEELAETDVEDTGAPAPADAPVIEEAPEPLDDAAPAAEDPQGQEDPEAPRGMDAAALWARLMELQNTL